MHALRKTLLATALGALATTGAHAADLYEPPIIEPLPVIEEEFASGWYLRGYVGMSNQSVDGLDNELYHVPNTVSVTTIDSGFDSAPFAGGAIGYRFNHWLRGDVSVEYRGRANYHGLDIYTDVAGDTYPDVYSASKSELLAMANAYVDLGTWRGITPFVGAGGGTSYNTIHSFRDVDPTVDSVAYANDDSQWQFAWALYAGLGYEVTPNLTMEIAYRYLDMGDAQSGDIVAYDGTNNFDNPMIFEGLTSHDVYLGFRYAM